MKRKVIENSELGSASTQEEGFQKSRGNKLTCDMSEKEEIGEHEERVSEHTHFNSSSQGLTSQS